ncbi:DNA-3-methyladenine glycosylase family protein [Deinococcus peraridilitoris]|uniref:DNA-3-methyladenine glycosylase II n=1 Tax=Deinococcus peraridilitoris (strain DSM 19664 / LMG 22246 / CIP 109416 / KR-200) TaxID=937777 RepID=L0A5Z8_DEIPD|nr:DNA-3-methyladenine glycosylase [Deinococcus peraridilitoris]AFZ68445.1 HhH-GPD superfamily base excision DNA repair protein [Deinococcus peraridilitoris DSM 19664]
MSDFDLSAGLAHLQRDPVLAALLLRADATPGVQPWWPPPERGTPFAALIRSVVGQQVSVKAAASIEGRLREVAPSLSPHELVSLSPEELRARGLSWAKVRTVHTLAQRAAEGLLDFEALSRSDDETVIEALSAVPGIGRWTAEMFLMFALRRPDVFSWGDAGLRKAVRTLYGPASGPEVAQKWSPYRSVAARLLWWSLHNEPQRKET